MANHLISVRINERPLSFPEGTTLLEAIRENKPQPDVLVVNGFPQGLAYVLQEGDQIVLINKGEIPSSEELEALLVARHTPGVHERVKNATVAVAGLGGLGTSVAVALARMGIGRLILVDFDVVEPSNLNRQQYMIKHLGMAKTQALSEQLSEINPYVNISAYKRVVEPGNVVKLFQEANVIVECFDQAEAKSMLLGAVHELLPDTFLILASGLAGYGDSNAIRTYRMGERLFVVGDLRSAAEPGRGLMAPRVGIAAHHQANLAVSLIMSPKQALEETEDILAHS